MCVCGVCACVCKYLVRFTTADASKLTRELERLGVASSSILRSETVVSARLTSKALQSLDEALFDRADIELAELYVGSVTSQANTAQYTSACCVQLHAHSQGALKAPFLTHSFTHSLTARCRYCASAELWRFDSERCGTTRIANSIFIDAE